MKMKLINIPIEPIEQRYSVQWDAWFLNHFHLSFSDVVTVYGDKSSGKIEHGSFLDVLDTNEYKTEQAKQVIQLLRTFDDSYRLVLFFHDLWFTDILKIAYIREGMGFKNLRICGCLHAGSYDEYDFLNKTGMTPWAQFFENALFGIVDQIYVATNFHKRLLLKKRMVNESHIKVTGFPIYMDTFAQPQIKKENIVVFPHRLDSEKQPELFDELAKRLDFTGWKFIKTMDVCKTKQDYYDLLAKSKIAVSFALQETWGIAMQEAALCGAIPVCPHRLSYQEMYLKPFRYYNFEHAVEEVYQFIRKGCGQDIMDAQITALDDAGKFAIPNIIKNIETL